jgi:hypothetical protein
MSPCCWGVRAVRTGRRFAPDGLAPQSGRPRNGVGGSPRASQPHQKAFFGSGSMNVVITLVGETDSRQAHHGCLPDSLMRLSRGATRAFRQLLLIPG